LLARLVLLVAWRDDAGVCMVESIATACVGRVSVCTLSESAFIL
jgi:hypothetical protein